MANLIAANVLYSCTWKAEQLFSFVIDMSNALLPFFIYVCMRALQNV